MGTTGALLHGLFELLGYLAGLSLLHVRRRAAPDPHAPDPHAPAVLAAAGVGAALGSKLLWMAQYAPWLATQSSPLAWMAGKTVVGGLLGGWAAVVLLKRALNLTKDTGDVLVAPLLLALVIGRLGCALAGPEDHTAGTPTTVAWAVDGLHPTALYEVLLAALALPWALRGPRPGDFALTTAAYLAARVGLDFLKPPFGPGPAPQPLLLGPLTPIQWAAAVGAIVAGRKAVRARQAARSSPASTPG